MIRALTTACLLAGLCIPALAHDKSKPAESCCKDGKCCCTETEKTASASGGPARVFELRTYYVNAGKMVDLNKRFREHTCQLLKKHGAELVGFWTPQDEKDGKSSKLIYLVSFPSREAAKQTWKEFGDDPEWKKVKEESQRQGVLVGRVDSVFLDPTDYSAIR